MVWHTYIDGAIVMPETKILDDVIEFPKTVNKEYRHAILIDEVFEGSSNFAIMASKDGKNYCIALAVMIGGELVNLQTIEEKATIGIHKNR